MSESNVLDYKSLKKVLGKSADLPDLAKTCVCFANAQGGKIIVGIEDKNKEPLPDQKISMEDVNHVITRLRSLTYSVGLANPEILIHSNGGEYFEFTVYPSLKSIATTSDGKIYIRFGDQCQPARSEDIVHLASEKDAFQWELVRHKNLTLEDVNHEEINSFVDDIKNSDKVSELVKGKSNIEILEHYNLIYEENLTNLGILWLGFPRQRSRLAYPVTVQYIVYDDKEEKVRKESWHSNDYNPKALLLDIEKKATELNYFHELPVGLFRKQVRHYPKEVIRELLVNALAHKAFTISGDIFVCVYPDRLEIINPGGLPTGITKENILHERHRRNPQFINIFHDLGLMEGEGSGYDLIYEKLSRDAKDLPEIYTEL